MAEIKFNTTTMCEYCGRYRTKGDHTKCSKKRKRDTDLKRKQAQDQANWDAFKLGTGPLLGNY
jgi:hypothetical protein